MVIVVRYLATALTQVNFVTDQFLWPTDVMEESLFVAVPKVNFHVDDGGFTTLASHKSCDVITYNRTF